MFDVNKLAEIIRSEGLPVASVDPLSNEMDGAIYLDDEWHVQVGKDYLIVMREWDDRFEPHSEAENIPQLLQILRKLFNR